MTAQHTPGPWAVKTDGEANYFTIADSKANWLMRVQHNGEPSTVTQDANARLIAAAPELLELCELSLRALHEDDFPQLRDQLRAAIARATA